MGYCEKEVLMSDSEEEREQLYRRPSQLTHEQTKRITELFHEIAAKASTCWKTKPDPDYLKKFVEYGLTFTRNSSDKFRKALDVLVKTTDTFPTISELEKAIWKIPKAPIEFLDKLDSRANCDACKSSGLIRLIDPFTEQEAHGYCHCEIGKYMNQAGTKGIARGVDLKSRGYVLFKEWRDTKRSG